MRKYLILLGILLLICPSKALPLNISYQTIPENPTVGDFVLRLYVQNAGTDITKVDMYISESEKDLSIVDGKSEVSQKYINLGKVPQGTAIAELKLRAKNSGLYELKVEIKGDLSEVIRNSIVIRVVERPSFTVQSNITLMPSSSKDVVVKVKNNGGTAKDVSISVQTPKGFSVDKAKQFYSEWMEKDEKVISFTMKADKDLEKGLYELNLQITFYDEFGNSYSESIPIPVQVLGEPELSISIDRVDPERIYPDSEFTMHFSLENTGYDTAKNLKVFLKHPEGFDGEGEKILGNLRKGESRKISFAMKSGSSYGSFPFEIIVKYNGKEIKKSFNLFVSERGRVSIDLAGVYTSPQTVYSGDTFKLSLQLENSGKQSAKAVSVKLILPEGIEGRNSYFIGTLESGDSATASFDLIANKNGEMTMKAIITYMDEKFDKYEEEKEFSIYVFQKGNPEILIGFGVLIALTIVYFVKRRMSKK
jgi:hypothetical protein